MHRKIALIAAAYIAAGGLTGLITGLVLVLSYRWQMQHELLLSDMPLIVTTTVVGVVVGMQGMVPAIDRVIRDS